MISICCNYSNVIRCVDKFFYKFGLIEEFFKIFLLTFLVEIEDLELLTKKYLKFSKKINSEITLPAPLNTNEKSPRTFSHYLLHFASRSRREARQKGREREIQEQCRETFIRSAAPTLWKLIAFAPALINELLAGEKNGKRKFEHSLTFARSGLASNFRQPAGGNVDKRLSMMMMVNRIIENAKALE